MIKKCLFGLILSCLALSVVGCGEEGPLGNTPPQGRPDWMKKKENAQPAAPAQPETPQKQ